MAQVPYFSILTLTCHFKVKMLTFYLINEYLVNSDRYRTYHYCHKNRKSYLLSNCAIANFVHFDIELHFQGQENINVNFWETVRASAKLCDMRLTEFDVCRRMAPCECCISGPWPRFINANISEIWKVNSSELVRASTKMFDVTFTVFYICHRMMQLQMLHCMILT